MESTPVTSTPASLPEPDQRSVEVAPGVHLNIRHHPGRGTPFLLVHGLSSNARLWDVVAAHLSDAGHAAYAVDLRSHGESSSPPDGYDTATAAADLASVCERLGLDRPVVVGQSWGGNVVVRLAARRPDLVRALALVDGGWIDMSAFGTWAAAETALRPPDIDGRPASEIRGYLVREHVDWSLDAIEATLANLKVEPDGTVTRRLSIEQHMKIVRSMWDDPPWPDYPAITVPVLLMPAVPDPARADDTARRRQAAIERAALALVNARVRPYVGGDHDLHAQHPAEVAADLLALAAET
ncbi:MAG: alpha/beta fold hydrolase [Betaproteobacteria bacterium]